MANEHRNNPIGYRYACSVPHTHCCGSKVQVSTGLGGTGQSQTHDSPESAFKCHKQYLLATGYTQHDSRGLVGPDGTVLVLTKPSRFGARLRGGKGRRWMSGANGHISSI
jgi:hypothetical protein